MGSKKDPPSPKKPAGGLHAGHRSRMRQRFLISGLDGFQDHEVLEFLLFYAVPRKDVNELAHILLSRFGTLAGVLDAPEEELRSVPGIGKQVAHFLTIAPSLLVQMEQQFYQDKLLLLRRTSDLPALLAARCPDLAPPQALLILLNAVQNVVAIHRYDSFERLDTREVATRFSCSRAAMVALVECVEDCTALPLLRRLSTLEMLSKELDIIHMPLWDYFTVDLLGHPPHSYAASGQLLPR